MTNLYNIWKKAAMVLITMCLAINAFAQDITLNGTVLDENNQPLTGAGVMVKGTTNGEVTDLDGKFTIWLSKKGVDITVSYIAYRNCFDFSWKHTVCCDTCNKPRGGRKARICRN